MNNVDNIGTLTNENSFHFNPLLDVNYLNDYYQENISDAAFVFDLFLNCTVQKFYEFIDSMLSNNHRKVYHLAHQMIPTFKLVGLTDIALLLKELESKARQSSCLHSLVKSIRTKFKKAIPIVFNQQAAIGSFLRRQKH